MSVCYGEWLKSDLKRLNKMTDAYTYLQVRRHIYCLTVCKFWGASCWDKSRAGTLSSFIWSDKIISLLKPQQGGGILCSPTHRREAGCWGLINSITYHSRSFDTIQSTYTFPVGLLVDRNSASSPSSMTGTLPVISITKPFVSTASSKKLEREWFPVFHNQSGKGYERILRCLQLWPLTYVC